MVDARLVDLVSVCPVRLVGGTRLKILDSRRQGLRVVALPEAGKDSRLPRIPE